MPGDKVKVRVVHPVAARPIRRGFPALDRRVDRATPPHSERVPFALARRRPAVRPETTLPQLDPHLPSPPARVSAAGVLERGGVPRAQEKGAATELMGMEGVVDSRADDHEGTYISANLEVRVALPVPDDPKGKTFIAHVREDEVEAL